MYSQSSFYSHLSDALRNHSSRSNARTNRKLFAGSECYLIVPELEWLIVILWKAEKEDWFVAVNSTPVCWVKSNTCLTFSGIPIYGIRLTQLFITQFTSAQFWTSGEQNLNRTTPGMNLPHCLRFTLPAYLKCGAWVRLHSCQTQESKSMQ